MKLFLCCVFLLPMAAVVVTTPIRGVLGTAPPENTVLGNFTDAFTDFESHNIRIPNVVGRDKALSTRITAQEPDPMGPGDLLSRLVPSHWSGGQSRTRRISEETQQSSRELIDLNSEEQIAMDAQEGNLSGKHAFSLSRVEDIGSEGVQVYLQRKAAQETPAGRSREDVDLDSLENVSGRSAAAANSRDVDYDESRVFYSSETYPVVPPRAPTQ